MATQQVEITLAHPIGTQVAAELGLPPRKYRVGETIQVTYQVAARLAASGRVAGADPTRPSTYQTAIRTIPPAVGKADKPGSSKKTGGAS